MRETALAVIGKNHGVMRRDFPTESVQVRKQNFLLRHTLEVSRSICCCRATILSFTVVSSFGSKWRSGRIEE